MAAQDMHKPQNTNSHTMAANHLPIAATLEMEFISPPCAVVIPPKYQHAPGRFWSVMFLPWISVKFSTSEKMPIQLTGWFHLYRAGIRASFCLSRNRSIASFISGDTIWAVSIVAYKRS
jgi:hypothetical protein